MISRFVLRSLLLLFSCVELAGAAPAQPNIVIMLVNDMGIMDTSVPFLTDDVDKSKRYPLNDYYRTSSMEQREARGVRFNNFSCLSVCSPTRISLMTGQNAAQHLTTNWINPDNSNARPLEQTDGNWRGLMQGDVTFREPAARRGLPDDSRGQGHFSPRDSDGADPTKLSEQTFPRPQHAGREAR